MDRQTDMPVRICNIYAVVRTNLLCYESEPVFFRHTLYMLCQLIFHIACLHFDAVVCDGGATNRGLWKEVGISGSFHGTVNSVPHPCPSPASDQNRRLFFSSEYVHLVKRNNMLNKKCFQVIFMILK